MVTNIYLQTSNYDAFVEKILQVLRAKIINFFDISFISLLIQNKYNLRML